MAGMRIGVMMVAVMITGMGVRLVLAAVIAGAVRIAQIAAGADAFDMMVMALLRRANLALKSQHLRRSDNPP
jgi:hypothetical protein